MSGHLCRLSSCDAARLAFHHVRHSCTGGWSRQAVGSVSGKPFLAPGGSKGRSLLSPLPFGFGLSGWFAWPCGPHFQLASFLELAMPNCLSCDRLRASIPSIQARFEPADGFAPLAASAVRKSAPQRDCNARFPTLLRASQPPRLGRVSPLSFKWLDPKDEGISSLSTIGCCALILSRASGI